jgi:hypothetical protein
MPANKYGKYVIQHPFDYQGDYGPQVWFTGESDYKTNFTELFIRVTRDMNMEEYPHKHDFDMWVWVLPLDPDNLDDLGCEVEMDFGMELEKHVVTKTVSFYIPKGVVHGPFIFRKVTKPLLFIHSMMAPKYYKTETYKS